MTVCRVCYIFEGMRTVYQGVQCSLPSLVWLLLHENIMQGGRYIGGASPFISLSARLSSQTKYGRATVLLDVVLMCLVHLLSRRCTTAHYVTLFLGGPVTITCIYAFTYQIRWCTLLALSSCFKYLNTKVLFLL